MTAAEAKETALKQKELNEEAQYQHTLAFIEQEAKAGKFEVVVYDLPYRYHELLKKQGYKVGYAFLEENLTIRW